MSFSRCLKKMGLSKHEAAILRGRIDELKGEGYEAHKAAVEAVKDHLDELKGHRAEVVKQMEAHTARTKPSAQPETSAPVSKAAADVGKTGKVEPSKSMAARARPAELRTPGQANNNNLKRMLHRDGIDKLEIRDITGEKNGKNARVMPGTFKPNGMTLDHWAERFVTEGWLAPESQSERGNENIRASMDDTRDFIRKVLNGDDVHRIGDQQDEAARQAHDDWVEHEAAQMAPDLSLNEVADLIDSGLTRAQNETAFDAGQEILGLPDDVKESILERAAIQADDDTAYAEAVRSLAAQERARLEGGEGNRDFALEAQDPASLAAKERAAKSPESIKAVVDRERDGFGLSAPPGAVTQAPENNAKNQQPLAAASPIFYSQLSRAIESKAPFAKNGEIGSGQLKMWLAAKAKDGTIKQAELDAVGLDDYLNLQPGKITKDQVQKFISQNGVRVEETTLGDTGVSSDMRHALFGESRADGPLPSLPDEWMAKSESFERQAQSWQRNGDDNKARKLFALAEEASRHAEGLDVQTGSTAGMPKFAGYQLPGGTNYKELLLTLPEKPQPGAGHYISQIGNSFVVYDGQQAIGQFETIGESKTFLRDKFGGADLSQRNFKSGHFDQPNILSHIRFNDRTDADGKKVLFIEEIQSDWAQKGKKEGFKDADKPTLTTEQADAKLAQAKALTAAIRARSNADRAAGLEQISDQTLAANIVDRDKVSALMQEIEDSKQNSIANNSQGHRIVTAPFVGKTEAWVALSLKRMIRYAAENGYDRVAFTTGEQQAARYDLSKQVDYIDYVREGADQYRVAIVGKDGQGINLPKETFSSSELENYVGKEVARKIVNGEGQGGGGRMTLRGPDLKVGGEGMRAFYDKIIPNVTNDVLKKLGGGRVGPMQVHGQSAIENRAFPNRKLTADLNVSGFDITLALRDSVMQGVPLFRKGEGKAATKIDEKLLSQVIYGAKAPDLMKTLVLNSDDPLTKGIARLFMQSGVNPTIRLGKTEDFQPEQLPAGVPANALNAMYDPASDTITLFNGETISHDILHEMAHAATYAAQKRGGIASRQMEALYAHVKSFGTFDDSHYGLQDVYEFLAEAFSNKAFQDELRAIPAIHGQKGSAWTWFTNLVRKILGLHENSHNALSQILEVGAQLTAEGETIRAGKPLGTVAQTGTKAFKDWFGDSKVVDKDGKPLVVYHGTNQSFDTFNPGKAGDKDSGWYGKGIYLTADTDAASAYASYETLKSRTGSSVGANVMPLYARLTNPYMWPKGRVAATTEAESAAITKELIAAGYDGVIVPNEYASEKSASHYEVIAFDKLQIKSATGNNGNFSSNPSILASRSDDRHSIRDAVGRFAEKQTDTRPEWLKGMSEATQAAAKKAGLWTEPKTLKERFSAATENLSLRLTQGLFDQFAPLKTLDYHSYILARMTKSGDAPLEGMMYYGKPFLDKDGAIDIVPEEGGLIGVLQKLGGETDRFMAWIAGNRAAQLKAAGKENLFTDDDISALKELNADKLPDGKSRAMLYAQVHKEFNAYGKSILDIAEKAGIISGQDRGVWEKDFYVPFYRVLEDEKVSGPRNAGGLTNQYAFKTLKGGTENLSDLFGNTLRNWSHLLNASLKNQAAASALSAAEKAGAAAPTTQSEKGTVFVLHDGKKQHYAVSDPLILDAITALDSAKLKGAGIDVASKFKHYLTLGVTISPTFRIRNLIRDMLQAMAITPVGMNPMQNLVSGFKGLDKKSPEYARMVSSGAFMQFGSSVEGDQARLVKRLIDSGVDATSILDSKTKVRSAMEAAWKWWEDVGATSENITRAAIYKKLIGEGKSHLIASFEARDSMDFSMQGAYPAVRLLTQIVPFMNARLQGMYKLGRDGITPTARVLYNTINGNPISASDRQKAIRFSAVTGAVMMASIALMLAYRDDDDWKNREEWDRDAFWGFKIGDKMFRIPKPFEIGALGSVAERGLEAMLDGMTPDARKRFLSRMGSITMDNLSMNPTPQLIKPLVDLYANKSSFTQRAIETVGMERLSKSERIGANTSATAQLLGKADVLSPVQIDSLIQGYFGWLGSHATMTVDYAMRPAMGLAAKPAMKIDDAFVLGDFVKQLPSDQSRYVTQFYDQAQTIQQAFADMRHYQALGQMDKAREIMEENKDKIALHQLYAHTQKEIGQINSRIRYTQMQTSDPDQKRTDLDRLYQLRNKLAETAENARVSRQAVR